MKITIFRWFSIAIVIVLTLAFVHPTLAHGDEPRLEISSDRMDPGGIVDVRGVSFGMEESVTLTLIGSSVEVSLGEVISDAEGGFMHIAVLPSDLVEATYYFRATTSHHWVISPPFTVWGTAVAEGGGQGLRDEDDGLLVPMPTFVPAVSTAPVTKVPVDAVSPSTWNRNILTWAALVVFGSIVLLGIQRKNKR